MTENGVRTLFRDRKWSENYFFERENGVSTVFMTENGVRTIL